MDRAWKDMLKELRLIRRQQEEAPKVEEITPEPEPILPSLPEYRSTARQIAGLDEW